MIKYLIVYALLGFLVYHGIQMMVPPISYY